MTGEETMTNGGLAVMLAAVAVVALIRLAVSRWRETSARFAAHQAEMDQQHPRVLLCEVSRCERPAATVYDASGGGLLWICSFHGAQVRRAAA